MTPNFYESKQDQESSTSGTIPAISNLTNAVSGRSLYRLPPLLSFGRDHAVYRMDAIVRHL